MIEDAATGRDSICVAGRTFAKAFRPGRMRVGALVSPLERWR